VNRAKSGIVPSRSGTSRAAAAAAALLAACVPTGSAPPYDAGTSATPTAPTSRPSVNVMTSVFEDDFERPDAGPAATGLLPPPGPSASASGVGVAAEGGPAGDGGPFGLGGDAQGGQTAQADGGEERASNLGPNWMQVRTSAWRIENGKLCGQGAHNHGVWLTKVLPVNARIEFDAMSTSDHGDLKAEVWGDGRSGATGVSYNNATSYLAILGGWKNTLHVLARLDEHGADRMAIKVDPESDDPRQKPVVKGQVYRFKIERTDGKTVRYSVDGVEYHAFVDAAPLVGAGHDHFGFNEWEVKTCYDNVKVTPL
jgi:hypothetical protein